MRISRACKCALYDCTSGERLHNSGQSPPASARWNTTAPVAAAAPLAGVACAAMRSYAAVLWPLSADASAGGGPSEPLLGAACSPAPNSSAAASGPAKLLLGDAVLAAARARAAAATSAEVDSHRNSVGGTKPAAFSACAPPGPACAAYQGWHVSVVMIFTHGTGTAGLLSAVSR